MERRRGAEMVEVRRVRAEDGQLVREVRLRALETDPDAFGSTAAAERSLPIDEWNRRAERDASGSERATYLALTGEAGVGMAGVSRNADEPDRFEVWGMWVAPEVRGRGTARGLIAAIDAWARSNGGRRLHLWVSSTAMAARRLYLGTGFVVDGQPEPHPHRPGATLEPLVRRIDGE